MIKTIIKKALRSLGYTITTNAAHDTMRREMAAAGHYNHQTADLFRTTVHRDLRNIKLSSIYEPGSDLFQHAFEALLAVEHTCIQRLISNLRTNNVRGDFAEFGIFQGAWINLFYDMTEHAGLVDRKIFGFDSFQGLSKPHEQFDTSFWKEGMYAAPRQLVEANVRANERSRIRLVEGFFSASLKSAPAAELREVAFARIDCDIYEPAKQCLEFLSNRLTHGSILVFDDWPHSFDVGEGRAFAEWQSSVPHLQFKFLFMGPWDHLHLRVLHRGKEDTFG